jgi:acetoin utilization protein AcuB
MFVRSYMTNDPVTVSPDDNFPQAMSVIRKRNIRHIPVLDKGCLVGIVVEKDLVSTQPSPATTLSLYEIYSLLETIRVRQIMSRPVITVEGDCPVEEAARIMVENRISCLPVMDGDQLVGIITETDVFKVLMEVLGGREGDVRFTLRLPERVGELANIASRIASQGGNIIAVTTSSVLADGRREMIVKVTGADRETLTRQIEACQVEILDIRPSALYEPRQFE